MSEYIGSIKRLLINLLNINNLSTFMNVKSALEKLEASDEYVAWKASHKDAYLTHIFAMLEKDDAVWQIGYFDPEGLIYSFEVADEIKLNEAQPPFGPEGTVIDPINMDDVKIKLTDALDKVSTLQHEKYSAHKPLKKIIILQVTKENGLVYNVTYVTETFKTLNIRIDANSGKVVEDKLVEIFKMTPGAAKPS